MVYKKFARILVGAVLFFLLGENNSKLVADLPSKLSALHAGLVTLKTKLQTIDTGLETLYEKLNPHGPPLFVAQTVRKLINPKLAGVTPSQDTESIDNVSGEYETTITYGLVTPDTSIKLEFKHHRNSREGSIALTCEGGNHYNRWQKVADLAPIIDALINQGVNITNLDNTKVSFTWNFKEKEWASRRLHIFVKSIMLLAQAVGGLQQEVPDSSGGVGAMKKVPGPVLTNEKNAKALITKLLITPYLLNRFLSVIIHSSTSSSKASHYFLEALHFINQSQYAEAVLTDVIIVINRYFQDTEFAKNTDISFFKAHHTSMTPGPGEQTIGNYDTITHADVLNYDTDAHEDAVKQYIEVGSYRGAVIQKIVQTIVQKQLHKAMDEATVKQLLECIQKNAHFFATIGSWKAKVYEASEELKTLLFDLGNDARFKSDIQPVLHELCTYGLIGGTETGKKNSTNLRSLYTDLALGPVPDDTSMLTNFFEQRGEALITQSPDLTLFKNLYKAIKTKKIPANLQQFFYEACPFTTDQKEKYFDQHYEDNKGYTARIDQALDALNFLREQGHSFPILDSMLTNRLVKKTLANSNFNFSWIVPYQLAGMRQPKKKSEIKFLEWLGVGVIVSLNTDLTKEAWWPKKTSIHNEYLYIQSGDTPTDAQIKSYFDIVTQNRTKNRRALVHCQFGQSRTGTMLAIWLIAHEGMTAKQAVDYLKTTRSTGLFGDQIPFVNNFK